MASMSALGRTLKLSVCSRASTGALALVREAKVALVRQSRVMGSWPYASQPATHRFDQVTGGYTLYVGPPGEEPDAGEWLLVVNAAGMSPVVQRLTLTRISWKDRDGSHQALRAAPGWASQGERGDAARAATVEITNAGVARRREPVARFSEVKVVLWPRREFVGFACYNYRNWDHTDYSQFVRDRRDVLYLRGTTSRAGSYRGAKLDPGSIATIFDAPVRYKRVYVKSAAQAASSWILVSEEQKANLAADAGRVRPEQTAAHEYGILDFYAHLERLGKEHPGTCVEAGVFGHGWVNGPILWDTADHSGSAITRDPDDLDGRQKDWLQDGEPAETATGLVREGPTQRAFPHLGRAFVQERNFAGRLRIWGCSHMRRPISEMTMAWAQLKLVDQGKMKRSELFRVPLRDAWVEVNHPEMEGWEYVSLDHLKANIFRYVSSRRFDRIEEDGDARGAVSYLGAAAQVLRRARVLVFGAPPGMGALYRGVEGTGRRGAVTFYIQLDGGENGRAHRYLEREFGPYYELDEDGLGYLNYCRMLELPRTELADPGWATGRSMAFYDRDQMAAVLRLPSGLEVHKQVDPAKTDDKIRKPFKDDGIWPRKAFLQPQRYQNQDGTGHLYVVTDCLPERVEVRGRRLVLVLRRQPGTDIGLHVLSDGQTLLLYRSQHRAPWQRYREGLPGLPKLPRVIPTYYGESQWLRPHRPATPATVSEGILERVEPRCYW